MFAGDWGFTRYAVSICWAQLIHGPKTHTDTQAQELAGGGVLALLDCRLAIAAWWSGARAAVGWVGEFPCRAALCDLICCLLTRPRTRPVSSSTALPDCYSARCADSRRPAFGTAGRHLSFGLPIQGIRTGSAGVCGGGAWRYLAKSLSALGSRHRSQGCSLPRRAV